MKGFLYGLVWLATAAASYFPANRIRILFLRTLRANVSTQSILYYGVFVRSPWRLTIGHGTVVGHNCHLDARGNLEIGSDVNLSSEVNIWTNEHAVNATDFGIIQGKVTIEDHAWIGNRAILLPGITVGRGAVVCSGAVVTKDVAPYTIVGGVPARKIGERSTNLQYSPAAFGKIWFV